jgi:hypothetical protein
MAFSALVIVLAESVASAAAELSFAAAVVTFVAADVTARGVALAAVVRDPAVRAVVVRPAGFDAVVLAAVVCGAADLGAVVLAGPVPAACFLAPPVRLAAARVRAGVAAVVCVGTGLPPHHDQLRRVSFHRPACFTHRS